MTHGDLRIPVPEGRGVCSVARRGGLMHRLALDLLRLAPGESAMFGPEDAEAVIVPMRGACQVGVEGEPAPYAIGGRDDPFEAATSTVYIPSQRRYAVTAHTGLEAARITAATDQPGRPFLVEEDDVVVERRGRDTFGRVVRTIVGEQHEASTLLVGETINDDGCWSSYPPHKHDTHDPPHEVALEELYHVRQSPGQGFGLVRVYSSDRTLDEVMAVGDRDTVLIPRGYHTAAGAPGYRLYYLWALAGPVRRMCWRDDPDHGWASI